MCRLSLGVESRGYSPAVVHRLLIVVASLVLSMCPGACALLWLWHTGILALQCVESSWTRDRTHVPCIGRRSLNHWTARKFP